MTKLSSPRGLKKVAFVHEKAWVCTMADLFWSKEKAPKGDCPCRLFAVLCSAWNLRVHRKEDLERADRDKPEQESCAPLLKDTWVFLIDMTSLQYGHRFTGDTNYIDRWYQTKSNVIGLSSSNHLSLQNELPHTGKRIIPTESFCGKRGVTC